MKVLKPASTSKLKVQPVRKDKTLQHRLRKERKQMMRSLTNGFEFSKAKNDQRPYTSAALFSYRDSSPGVNLYRTQHFGKIKESIHEVKLVD